LRVCPDGTVIEKTGLKPPWSTRPLSPAEVYVLDPSSPHITAGSIRGFSPCEWEDATPLAVPAPPPFPLCDDPNRDPKRPCTR
jgi:hypothetical protein